MGGGNTKTDGYDLPVGTDLRIRVHLQIVDGRVHRFAVSLEVEWSPADWRRVVCIDNWGGSIHRDRYRPDGTDLAHHEPLFDTSDIDLGIKQAVKHLEDHAQRYVTDFRRML